MAGLPEMQGALQLCRLDGAALNSVVCTDGKRYFLAEPGLEYKVKAIWTQ